MTYLLETDFWIMRAIDAAILLTALFIAKAIQLVLVRILQSKKIFHTTLTGCVLKEIRTPLLFLLIIIAVYAALPLTYISEPWLSRIQLVLKPAGVAMLGWIVIGLAHGIAEWLGLHYANAKKVEAKNTLDARRFTTQIRLLMRIIVAIIIVLTIIGMAMVIPPLRQLGMSLFASAGVAGIVLGVAAKESLSNLIAGAQLALTQQILLGDEVTVEGDFGTIEEITSSYVVIRSWELKRFIVPLRYFMENSFTNWTYRETNLFGPVYLYTDYDVDMAGIRIEARRIAEQSSLWDKKRLDVLVTDSTEQHVKIRIAVSAKNSSELWDLQCLMREQLLDYLKREQPEALPSRHIRIESSMASNGQLL